MQVVKILFAIFLTLPMLAFGRFLSQKFAEEVNNDIAKKSEGKSLKSSGKNAGRRKGKSR